MSPFQLVYGVDEIFPTSLGIPVLKVLQESQVEINDLQRRINQTIQFLQAREEVYNKTQLSQDEIKKIHDRRAQADDFQIDDLVLKWDSRNANKGKHVKFDSLWKGPYKIETFGGSNAFLLKDLIGEALPSGPINCRILKH